MFISHSKKIFSYMAPAKVNLSLKISKKRPDGYHELASVAGFTEFGDCLTIKLSNIDQLAFFGQFSADIDTETSQNLVMRAVKTLRDHNYNVPPLQIRINKQIPVGGGLGGGSSNAATTFLALDEIFNLNLSKTNLEKMALKIGADIPVCLYRDFVVMRGVGDKITKISNARIANYIVLANPNSIVSTKDIFEEFDKNALEEKAEWFKNYQELDQLLTCGNSLQESAIKIYPEIGILLNTMKTLYLENNNMGQSSVQMSGSGASCFALFEDKKNADIFCKKIQQAGYWSVSTKFISDF